MKVDYESILGSESSFKKKGYCINLTKKSYYKVDYWEIVVIWRNSQ